MAKRPERLDFEAQKAMGFGRARAIEAMLNNKEYGDALPEGLGENDFRCDAEQVELGKDGVVRKSRQSRITRES